uniref:DUF3850 domain-containing protein n=1 Tax=Steinernema glaseri TaxID=37863 RepID=A0A1I7XY57_9BILA
MAMGVNGQARRTHEDEILQCYYDTLCKLLEKRGQRADFTLDQVKRAYRGGFVGQTVFTLVSGSFLLKLQEWEDKVIQTYLVRAQLALEDALERLKELPEEKLID